MKRFSLFSSRLITLYLLALPLLTHGATGVEQLNHFLTNSNTLRAKFEQAVLDKDMQRATTGRGTLYMLRPNRFRWDYVEPYEQQIIADGTRVWLNDKELEQVSVRSQSAALEGTPALLLSSNQPADKHFEVTDIGRRQGYDWVELIPRKEDGQFTRILLAFIGNELHRMEMLDKFGQTTHFQFYEIKVNPELEESLFHFEPPSTYEQLFSN